MFADECMPGYSCVNRSQGDAGATCVKLCQPQGTCPSPFTCMPFGTYGYCL